MDTADSAEQAPLHKYRCGSFAMLGQTGTWRQTLFHNQEETALLWITRGQARAVVNGHMHGISMHMALYLPAGTLFSLELTGQSQALMMEAPHPAMDPPGSHPAHSMPYSALPKVAQIVRVKDSFAQAELTGYMDAMGREIKSRRPALDQALAAHASLIGVWLQRQIKAGATELRPKASPSQRLLDAYIQSIKQDFASPQVMADYAELLGITPTHLTRICKDTAGRTASDLLTDRRLYAARVALEDDVTPIQQIATDLNFGSPAYFTRFVKTHTGFSPSALRKGQSVRSTGAGPKHRTHTDN